MSGAAGVSRSLRFAGGRSRAAGFLAALLLPVSVANADSVVVFNEIMYHPAEGGEWIELQNQMAVDIDLSGWRLSGGIEYAFPDGTIVEAGGYLVVAELPVPGTGALGPWNGRLDNAGETIRLRDINDRVMDEVDYRPDGTWPVAPDGGGPSLARVAKFRDGRLASSWAASAVSGGTPGAENFGGEVAARTVASPAGASWKFDASGEDPGDGWQAAGADDGDWPTGTAAFVLGEDALPAPSVPGTALPSGPVTYRFRRTFAWSGRPENTALELRALLNDGAIVYLNGVELARFSMPDGDPHPDLPASAPAPSPPVFRTLTVPAGALVPGENLLAAELHQAGPSAGYPAAVLTSGPVGYWRLDEMSGPAINAVGPPGALSGSREGFGDAGRGAAGPRPADTAGGTPLAGFEAENAAAEFQGNGDGGDDVVLVADNSALDFSEGGALTLEAWVRGSPSQESGAAIIARGTGGGGEQYAVDVVGGAFRFFVRDGNKSAVVAQSAVALDNTWQHVVAAFDRFAGVMTLYVNGVPAATAAPPATLQPIAHDLSIGARKSSSQPAYNLNFDGIVDEVAVYNRALSASEVAAHFQAAGTAAGGDIDTSTAVFDLELTAIETLTPGGASPLRINELADGQVELINSGGSPASLEGWQLRPAGTGNPEPLALPATTLSAGGYLTVPLEFSPGDRVFLVAPDGHTIADAAAAGDRPVSRFPDGTGPWLNSTSETPGVANRVVLTDAVVISEIMYDPPDASLLPAGTTGAGEWIELYNRSAEAVDLSGWSLDDAVAYSFPAGATIPAGGWCVVAGNVSAFSAHHSLPAGALFGPWTGGLSGRAETIVLRDAAGNPADEVSYASGGRWPSAANGGGSSLELRDPQSDNGIPEAWAASDESDRAPWQTLSWTGPNRASQSGEPTLWHELNLLLVDGPGECLVDDVSVTDTVTGENLIRNGSFDEGAAHWRFLGTHRHSRVEPEPGNPGNSVLHVVATGPGEYQGNQIETTFAGNRALANNRTYTISLRARWIGGGARLNTRLYFNRLPRTNVLAISAAGGTPGAANSRSIPNAGPTWSSLVHSPVLPDPGEPVTVSAVASDPQGIANARLHYSVQGGAWVTVPMTSADGRRFTATVPGQASGVVQFYGEATDGAGALSRFPADGPDSRAMFAVRNGSGSDRLPEVRLVMTPADVAYLHEPVNTLSNEYLKCTVIADGTEAHYDAGVRLKGSFVGRNVSRVGFTLRFPPDRPFRGVHEKIAIDRSQHTALAQGELVLKYMACRAGGIPCMYDDLGRFVHPRGSYTGTCQIRMTAFDDDYLDTQFPDGGDGPMYEFEVIRWNLQTVDGNPESPKAPGNEGSGTGYRNLEVADYGTDREAYRWMMLQNKDRDRDAYDDAIALCRMFSKSGSAFDAEARTRLDNESWLRTLAFQSLVGPADSAYTGSNIHNFRLYLRPHDRRWMYLPWDWDSAFQRPAAASLTGSGNLAKVVTASPDRQRRYLWHLKDIIDRVYTSSAMSRWTQHYGSVAGESYSGILGYIGSRSTYVRSRLPGETAFGAGAGEVDSSGSVTLSGSADLRIRYIEIGGRLYDPVWTSDSAWSLTLPLAQGTNFLTVRGTDGSGAPIAGALASIAVENPFPPVAPTLAVSEWMANGEGDDWFEIRNTGSRAVDIGGWLLSDDPGLSAPFAVPAGWTVPAGGYLLVIADSDPSRNQDVPAAGDSLHVGFGLSADGESIVLADPTGRPIDNVTFGPQLPGVSYGRVGTDGRGIAALTIPTPGEANVFAEIVDLRRNAGSLECTVTTTPGWQYRLEQSPDLAAWSPVAPAAVADDVRLTFSTPAPESPAYLRVRVSR